MVRNTGVYLLILCMPTAVGAAASSVSELNRLAETSDTTVPLKAGKVEPGELSFLNRTYRMLTVPAELIGLPRVAFNGGDGAKIRLKFRADGVVFTAFEYNSTGDWSFDDGLSPAEHGWALYKAKAYRGDSNKIVNGKEHFADVYLRRFQPGESLPEMPRWWLCLGIVDLAKAKTFPHFEQAISAPPPRPRLSHLAWATRDKGERPFPLGDPKTLQRWQHEMRRQFVARLVFDYEGKVSTTSKPPVEIGDHTEQEITFLLDGRKLFRAFRLAPKQHPPGKHPAVVCFMGHGKVSQVLRERDSYQHACAGVLADHGYLVYAMENIGMEPAADRHLDLDQMLRLWGYGWYSLLFAHQRMLLDHVFADPAVDAKRVGVTGVSTGGLLALSVVAADPRVRSASVQGIFGSMRKSFIADRTRHCKCGAIPNLLPDFDLPTLAAMVAPRPLHISNGAKDGFGPAEAKRCVELVRPAFRLFDADSRMPMISVPPGGHAFALRPALDFFEETLR